MRRILLVSLFLLSLAPACWGATLFTTTIRETDTGKVQDMILEVMTGKNFTVDEVDPYKVVVAKNFGDGFWLPTQLCKVKFNMLQRDGNVRLLVSELELLQGQVTRQRSIDHLIPLIQEIRNKLDGTPIDQVVNEAVNQLPDSGNVRKKSLGIVLGDRNPDGYVAISSVEAGSKAADAGLVGRDVLLEVNGRSTKEMDTAALRSYLANKAAEEASLVLVYSRRGTPQGSVTIR